MNEKVIVESKLDMKSVKRVSSLSGGIIVFFSFVWYLLLIAENSDWINRYDKSFGEVIFSPFYRGSNMVPAIFAIILAVVGIVVGIIIYLCLKKTKLVVTDKRVYGLTAFRKRIDLPLDSISAVGKGIFGSISITTASGAIRFFTIENRDVMYNAVNKLLLNRQQNSRKEVVPVPVRNVSNADELKKYKELLDMGAITQEEYDAKKKQLLSL